MWLFLRKLFARAGDERFLSDRDHEILMRKRYDDGLGQLEWEEHWVRSLSDYAEMKIAIREKGVDVEKIAFLDVDRADETSACFTFGFADGRWGTFLWDGREIMELEFHDRLDLEYPTMAAAIKQFLEMRETGKT